MEGDKYGLSWDIYSKEKNMLHLRIIIHYCQITFLLMGQNFEWGVCTSQRMVTIKRSRLHECTLVLVATNNISL